MHRLMITILPPGEETTENPLQECKPCVTAGASATISLWNCTSTDSFVNTSSGTLNATNCIVWGAGISTGGKETLSYSIVEGGYEGTGNLDVAPGLAVAP
jgi:hypothetical protein